MSLVCVLVAVTDHLVTMKEIGFEVYIRPHWPNVCYGFENSGKLLCCLMIKWIDCFARGCESLFDLSTAALFVIAWSCFLGLASMSCLLYLLLTIGTAVSAVRYLGYTHGLLIVGLFSILFLRMYANFWIIGPMLIVGGFLFSLNHTRLVVLVALLYTLYYVKHHVGWSGILISINLAFISCDTLVYVLYWCDNLSENTHCKEQKVPQTESYAKDDFPAAIKFCDLADQVEQVSPCKSWSKPAVMPTFVNKQKKASTISMPVLKNRVSAINEIKRIMSCVDHYEVLGYSRYKKIDATLLKKEYKKKAMLVHPDKNMGSPMASESFKKVQCAFEVLSDCVKKRDYDKHLRNEESKSLCQKFPSTEYYSEESRHIQCKKCEHLHVWICTNRNKLKARWCQDCCQYHQAKDGDGWVEYKGSLDSDLPQKVKIPRAFVCAQGKIFDVSEWAICQGMTCMPNTHHPSFHVKMVGLKKTQKCSSSTYPWDLDGKMTDEEEEFNIWLQQAVALGLFCDTSKRRKSWIRFKLSQKKGLLMEKATSNKHLSLTNYHNFYCPCVNGNVAAAGVSNSHGASLSFRSLALCQWQVATDVGCFEWARQVTTGQKNVGSDLVNV
nr:DnaJ domain, cleavage inducing molecular chaperone, Jiv [Tanacetum cinerariifolium]